MIHPHLGKRIGLSLFLLVWSCCPGVAEEAFDEAYSSDAFILAHGGESRIQVFLDTTDSEMLQLAVDLQNTLEALGGGRPPLRHGQAAPEASPSGLWNVIALIANDSAVAAEVRIHPVRYTVSMEYLQPGYSLNCLKRLRIDYRNPSDAREALAWVFQESFCVPFPKELNRGSPPPVLSLVPVAPESDSGVVRQMLREVEGDGEAFHPAAMTIGLIGDSTVATTYGWGPAFADKLVDSAKVLNYAQNGATLASLSVNLDRLMEQKPDFVLIQFGHNDMKQYGSQEYRNRLTDYVRRVKQGGSQAVVLSSVTRRVFDEDGQISPRVINGDRSLPAFAKVARAVADENEVPFIDLNAISIERHNAMGPEASAAYNFQGTDRTHFSTEGAAATAEWIVSELGSVVPGLSGLEK